MAYRHKANLSLAGFQNSLVNTFLKVFNNDSLHVNVLTVAESSQDHKMIKISSYGNTPNKRRTAVAVLIRGRRLLTFPCAALN